MADALAEVVHKLESLLHPTPSQGYEVRFWAQVALNSLLLLCCVVYLLVAYYESRRVGKSLALFRVQRVASGRFVVVNALVLLVLFDAIAAVLMLILRYKLYVIYFMGSLPINKLVVAVQGWSPITLVAWAYSFGNIAAMMQIKTRDFGGPSRGAIILYNVSFVSTLLIAFGLGLPFCLIANSRMNSLIRTAEVLLDIVHQSQVTRTPLSPSEQQAINALLATIKACQRDTTFWIRAVLILAGCISCLTAFSAAASFWFVAFLSEFPNSASLESDSRTPTLVNASAEHEITFLGLGAPDGAPIRISRNTRAPKTSKATFGTSRPQNLALKRLSKDLTLSVPIVLVLSVYCMVLAILTGIHIQDHAFAWQEVMYDGVSWSSIVLLLIIAAFLHNLLKYRNHHASRRGSSGQPIHLSMSPPVSPRRCVTSGRYVVEEIKDGGADRSVEFKMDVGTETLEALASKGHLNTYDIAIATRGDEGVDWMEMDKMEGRRAL